MDQVTLSARRRVEAGTRPAKRMRRDGFVPAVVYGRGLDPMPVAVSSQELYTALHTEAGFNALINVEVDGEDTVLAVAREIQRHPVRGEITHLDFIKVSLDTAIEAEVSIDFGGEPVAVREEGAIVEHIATSVVITALPGAIPSSILLDISHLVIGDTLKIADLPEIEGVGYVDDPESPIVTVLVPRLAEPEAPTEAEAEEGVEALGAEGESIEDADTEGDHS